MSSGLPLKRTPKNKANSTPETTRKISIAAPCVMPAAQQEPQPPRRRQPIALQRAAHLLLRSAKPMVHSDMFCHIQMVVPMAI